MNLIGKRGGLALAAILMTVGAAAHAASPVSLTLKDLSGNTSQPATQAALATAGLTVFNNVPEVAFDAAGAHFGTLAAGDAGRNYMRTAAGDYATVDFTAEITFATANNDQAVFIGLGSGDTALFGTPDWSTQLSSASFWPETSNDKITVFKTANDVNAFVDRAVAGFAPGVHRFQMTFNATTGFLVGSIDVNYAGGPFVADVTTLPVATKAGSSLFAADGWPTEPSRVFFGGDDGVVFSDLTIAVVPEPSSIGLVMVALAPLLRRRSRRGDAPRRAV